MPSSKRSLTERIKRILDGGYPSTATRVKDPEIEHAIGSAMGRALRMEVFNTTYQLDGGSIPDGSMLATYEGITVVRGSGMTAKARLPVTPSYLPERMGVFSVYPSGYPEKEYMPVPPGIINIWKGNKILNPINETIYSWDSGWVTIYEDLVGAGIGTVDMKLAVVDISHLDDYDPLPIPPDMEGSVIAEVLQLLGAEPRTERDNDKASPAKGE